MQTCILSLARLFLMMSVAGSRVAQRRDAGRPRSIAPSRPSHCIRVSPLFTAGDTPKKEPQWCSVESGQKPAATSTRVSARNDPTAVFIMLCLLAVCAHLECSTIIKQVPESDGRRVRWDGRRGDSRPEAPRCPPAASRIRQRQVHQAKVRNFIEPIEPIALDQVCFYCRPRSIKKSLIFL